MHFIQRKIYTTHGNSTAESYLPTLNYWNNSQFQWKTVSVGDTENPKSSSPQVLQVIITQ